jgi:hypothetical protein
MKKSRRLVVVALALILIGIAAWWLRQPDYVSIPLSRLPSPKERVSSDGRASWPELGLEARLMSVTERATARKWDSQGNWAPTLSEHMRMRDQRPNEKLYGFEFSFEGGFVEDGWRITVDVPRAPVFSVRKQSPSFGFYVPSSLDKLDCAIVFFDRASGKRVGYFSHTGSDTENGITYTGPGYVSRLLSLGWDSSPESVEFDLSSDYDGFAVWIIPQFSDGTRLPEDNSVSRPVLATHETRHRVLLTQFGDKQVVGWHVYATPSYRFTLKGIPLRPKQSDVEAPFDNEP